MNIIKATNLQEQWKTYRLAWNDQADNFNCHHCHQIAHAEIGLMVKSETNHLVCNECAIRKSPKIAKVLFVNRLNENPNDEDAASYLADIEKMRIAQETQPANLTKAEFNQIHQLTNSVKLMIWSEKNDRLAFINFLVPVKWLLNNDEHCHTNLTNKPIAGRLTYIHTAPNEDKNTHIQKLHERALNEGVIIAENIEEKPYNTKKDIYS